MSKYINNNCDSKRCVYPDGEVRILPLGADSNLIVCRQCYEYEIRYRKTRNAELGWEAYKLPEWKDLKVYEGAGEWVPPTNSESSKGR